MEFPLRLLRSHSKVFNGGRWVNYGPFARRALVWRQYLNLASWSGVVVNAILQNPSSRSGPTSRGRGCARSRIITGVRRYYGGVAEVVS